jgi:pimeloyl-ACP methyl ester carboxylesterase
LFNEKKFNGSMKRVFSDQHQLDKNSLNIYWRLLCINQGHKILHKLSFYLKERKLHGKRWTEAWQSSTLPIRYLAGHEDPMYGTEALIKLKKLSRKKEIIGLPSVGHFPHIEAPEKVAQHILKFLLRPNMSA